MGTSKKIELEKIGDSWVTVGASNRIVIPHRIQVGFKEELYIEIYRKKEGIRAK